MSGHLHRFAAMGTTFVLATTVFPLSSCTGDGFSACAVDATCASGIGGGGKAGSRWRQRQCGGGRGNAGRSGVYLHSLGIGRLSASVSFRASSGKGSRRGCTGVPFRYHV